jgi:hypothetical protein
MSVHKEGEAAKHPPFFDRIRPCEQSSNAARESFIEWHDSPA